MPARPSPAGWKRSAPTPFSPSAARSSPAWWPKAPPMLTRASARPACGTPARPRPWSSRPAAESPTLPETLSATPHRSVCSTPTLSYGGTAVDLSARITLGAPRQPENRASIRKGVSGQACRALGIIGMWIYLRSQGMTSPITSVTHARSPRSLTRRLRGFIRGRLWLQVLVAMAAGILAGVLLGPTLGWVTPGTAHLLASWAALPGYLFLAMVQMIVIPLVVASIILGMASTDSLEQLRQTGLRTGAFFIATTLAAGAIGVAVVLLIQPGSFIDSQALAGEVLPTDPSAPLSLAELPQRLTSIIPTNPLQAGVEQNMLQMVVFSIMIGVALLTLPERQSRPLLELLGSVQELSMVVVRWAMFLVPFAVFGLMLQLTTRL